MTFDIIPAAMAAGATPAAGPGGNYQFLLFIAIFALFFYFILWRPQSKRAKEHRDLISNLAVGDEIYTSGGLLGKIHKITDDFIELSISNGVNILVQKPSVAGTLPKGTMENA
ncbi:MAG: preprotein translocase subunit YajC [Gammaproteobacteria bacterium]